MSRKAISPGLMSILTAFRDSEDCDGDPTRPMKFDRFGNSEFMRSNQAGFVARNPKDDGEIILTTEGLALFRQAFPDHSYTLDWAESEREANSRREYFANLIIHIIEDRGLSPISAADRFAEEHFGGHKRTVARLDGDCTAGGWVGTLHLAEDDIYRPTSYRFRFDEKAKRWEFRANLA